MQYQPGPINIGVGVVHSFFIPLPSFKGTVQWQLMWVKIGINRSNMTNCLAGKYSLPCPNGHHHERSINFSASLVHFNTIPTGWVSEHYSVGLIIL
jgi:hypothetical protein